MKKKSLETIELLCDTLECFIEDFLHDINPSARCPDIQQLCIKDTEVCFPLLGVYAFPAKIKRQFKREFPRGRIEEIKQGDNVMYCAILKRGWSLGMDKALKVKKVSGKRSGKKKKARGAV